MIEQIISVVFPYILSVRGASMMPTLRNGQVRLYNPFVCSCKRGDIVIANVNGEKLVKRIIATEYEELRIDKNGVVSINGKTLHEPYVDKSKPIHGMSIRKIIPQDCGLWVTTEMRLPIAVILVR